MITKELIYKYKDEKPMETITKVRANLSKLGILAQESWKNIGSNIFSVHLVIYGTSIVSDGKGCTKELALASAYGELIERLSFLLPFRVSYFYDIFYDSFNNICTDKKINFYEWLNSRDGYIFFKLLQKYNSNDKNLTYENFKKNWISRKNTCLNYDFALKYRRLMISESENQNISLGSELEIPYALLDFYYGSNGMCAGNTREEALTQGICEIIERYAQREIILGNNIEIYDITDSLIVSCENISKMIYFLQEVGYKVRILECSTMFRVPVVATIIMKDDCSYYVSFGCHSNIFIATERAIDELFQGYNLSTFNTAFTDECIIELINSKNKINYLNLLKYGIGMYPVEFIFGAFEKKEILKSDYKYKTNNELFFDLIEHITNLGIPIYINKGLSLGLPSYHIIILGISEASEILPSKKIRNKNIECLYDDLSNITEAEAVKMSEYCELVYFSGARALNELLDINNYINYCNCETNTEGISIALFISMINIKAKKWKMASKFLKKYIDELASNNDICESDLSYYKVLNIILQEKEKGWSNKQILESLQIIDVRELLDMVNLGEDLFDELPKLSSKELLDNNIELKEIVDYEKEILINLIKFGA